MTTAQELQSDLNTLVQRLSRARRDLLRGEVIDLTTVQDTVAGYCRAIEALPVGERDALEPGLVSLIEELDCLSKVMQEGLTVLGGALSETSQRRRALNAYGKKA